MIIPPAHLLPPEIGELFATREEAIERLQNFAFTRGFAVVTRSSEPDRVKYACVHKGDSTRNWPGTALEDRKRLETHTNALGCKWRAYISQRKGAGGRWVFGWTHKEHNHDGNPDPFSLPQHKDKQHRYGESVARAVVHRGTTSYTASTNLLRREDLPILSLDDY